MVWKVKELQMKVKNISVSYSYIPREKNKEADSYDNLALDGLV